MTTSWPTHESAVDCPPLSQEKSRDIWAEEAVDDKTFSALRRRMVLEGCKWDPQVGDVETLSPFPLVMKASTWRQLASQAEQLTAEAISSEEEILGQPELLKYLGLPRALREVLAKNTPLTPAAGRIVRFDFHYTTEGWQISEANSDVPGGFTEASHFTSMMAELFPHFRPAGNPAEAWCDALAAATGRTLDTATDPNRPLVCSPAFRRSETTKFCAPPKGGTPNVAVSRSAGAGPSGVVALLSAPGYMEDYQVVSFLAARLRERGCCPHLAKPEQVVWRNGLAHLDTTWHRGPLDAIVRFYQAEWLARLPVKSGWEFFFRGGRTPTANPAPVVIWESKRFPLVWDKLSTALPTWRALLPETRDPWDAPLSRDDGWLLKTAFCNTGDTVSVRELMRSGDWLRTRLAARLSPSHWVAQRRFESLAVSTPLGPRHFCVGVYTVNGRAAGAYTRCSPKPVIDFSAADVALLLQDDE